MSPFTRLWRRILHYVRRGQFDRELEEEMRFHLEMRAEENVACGMAPEEARRAARRQFGNETRLRELSRDTWGFVKMESLLQDLRFAARVLVKDKTFTAVVVLTLALGVGANTAIFSVVNELLVRPLPFPEAERLVMLWEFHPNAARMPTSRANFLAWREQSTAFEGMAAFTDRRLNLTGGGDPEEIPVQFTTPELFRVLGIEPLHGRTLTQEDARPGATAIAVLSHGIWQRRFGGDLGVIGKPVMLGGAPHTVVGVLPAGFQWHVRQRSSTAKPAEIWTVLEMPT
jgi:putative ABC transport system permease protein